MNASKRNDDDRHHKSNKKRRHRSPERHERRSSADRSRKHRHDDERQSNSKHKHTKIKTEEEFDKRHDELSRRRRDEKHQMRYEVKNENDRRNKKPRQDIPEHERYGRPEDNVKEEPIEKEQPNLGLSGALTEDTNTYRGVVIKYNEPPEARIPKKKWRLYPFKGDEELKVLHLHRQSGFLIGKLRRVVDIPVDHPSCSKQHAVFQFRLVSEKADGKTVKKVKPYIIDLESTNGTYVNNNRIDPRRYVELKEQDVLKFGFSSREYVLLHDKVDTSQVGDSDDDSD